MTLEPSRFQTDPSSRPMYPPPTTTRCSGTLSKQRASVELTIVLPSKGMKGRFTGSLPVASRMWAVSSVVSPPSLFRTTTRLGEATRAVPKIGSILFFLNRPRTPPVSPLTTSSLRASIAGTSSSRPPTLIPCLENRSWARW